MKREIEIESYVMHPIVLEPSRLILRIGLIENGLRAVKLEQFREYTILTVLRDCSRMPTRLIAQAQKGRRGSLSIDRSRRIFFSSPAPPMPSSPPRRGPRTWRRNPGNGELGRALMAARRSF